MNQVLIILSSSSIGGAEKSLSLLSKDCNENSIRPLPITLFNGIGNNPLKNYCNSNKIRYRMIKGNFLTYAIKLIFLLRKKQIRGTIIYICGIKISIVLRLAIALQILSKNIKVIHAIRWVPRLTGTRSLIDWLFVMFEPYLSKYTDFWIGNSKKSIAKTIELTKANVKQTKVIYNTIDPKFFESTAIKGKKTQRKPYILHVANISKRKGHEEFLEQLKKSNLSINYFSAGKIDKNQYCKSLTEKYGSADNIKFLGVVRPNELHGYYENCMLTVLPSLYNEGCPTTILESLILGRPVIAFDIDGIPELLAAFPELMIPFKRYDLLFKRINFYASNPQELERLSERLKEYYSLQYSPNSFYTTHSEVFNELSK